MKSEKWGVVMNKRIKKIAALLAAACIPLTGLPAWANYCETNWSTFANMEQFDDHGMLQESMYPDARFYIETYQSATGQECHRLVRATPIPRLLCFAAREPLTPEIADEIAGTLDPILPGLYENVEIKYYVDTDTEYGRIYRNEQATLGFYYDEICGRMIHLYFNEEPENAAELEASILMALAKKHLISELYGFGQTVELSNGFVAGGGDYYSDEQLHDPDEEALERMKRDASPLGSLYQEVYGSDYTEVVRTVDLDAVQAVLDEKYPGLFVETYDSVPFLYKGKDRVERTITLPLFRIVGAEELPYVRQIELLCELAANCGLRLYGTYDQDAAEASRYNALEKPGDVTLDTEIGIVDVIALNRNIMTGDALCDTAKRNADLNGNGAPDETDALNLLKYIVGIEAELG